MIDDLYEGWEILSLDAVISLEYIQGQHPRVAISIIENQAPTYLPMKQRRHFREGYTMQSLTFNSLLS
jgi:hypothetical protein